jgi:hypothetical protein
MPRRFHWQKERVKAEGGYQSSVQQYNSFRRIFLNSSNHLFLEKSSLHSSTWIKECSRRLSGHIYAWTHFAAQSIYFIRARLHHRCDLLEALLQLDSMFDPARAHAALRPTPNGQPAKGVMPSWYPAPVRSLSMSGCSCRSTLVSVYWHGARSRCGTRSTTLRPMDEEHVVRRSMKDKRANGRSIKP